MHDAFAGGGFHLAAGAVEGVAFIEALGAEVVGVGPELGAGVAA